MASHISSYAVDQGQLPEDWPTHHGSPRFWEEPGRTVATFSFLEDMLARAYFGLTGTHQYEDIDQAKAAFPQWEKELKQTLTDSLHSLTSKLGKALNDDDRVSDDVAKDILGRLEELRVWRNALCHGAWQGFEADGAARLRHFRNAPDGPERLEDRLARESIFKIRAAAVDLTVDIVNAVTAAGIQFPGTTSPGIKLTNSKNDGSD